MNRRVVITGMGVCCPLGHTITEFSEALYTGRSGVRALECQAGEARIAIAAAVVDFRPEEHFSKLELTTLDRFSQMALLASREAMAGFPGDSPERRTGVYVGSGMGGANQIETTYQELFLKNARRVRPVTVVNIMNNAAAGHLAMRYRLTGTNTTFSNACASSANAIGEAFRAIRHGYLDAALTGGAEALLTFGAIHSWNALGVLSPPGDNPAAACRPFSKDRAGLVLGEGAAMLLLESEESARARGANILAVVAGYGDACDAAHLTKPESAGQADAMRRSLADAGLTPADIGHINAHGTATQAGDAAETASIREVFGANPPPVSATKSLHGHLQGAAGALECVATVCALQAQMLPPTLHHTPGDPACDLDYVPNAARPATFAHALSNSFAFGGANASLVLSRA